MKTHKINILLLLFVIAFQSSLCFSAEAILRWNIRAIETTWKENLWTGAVTDVRERKVLPIVLVTIRKELKDGKMLISFDSSDMKDSRKDQSTTGAYVPFADKKKLIDALKGAIKKMNKSVKEDYSEEVFSSGNIKIKLEGKKRKHTMIVSFSDKEAVFELDRVKASQFIDGMKKIK